MRRCIALDRCVPGEKKKHGRDVNELTHNLQLIDRLTQRLLSLYEVKLDIYNIFGTVGTSIGVS